MLTKLARVGLTAVVLVLAATTFSLAETSATPAPNVVVSQATPAPKASPKPFTWNGYVRSYDFFRDNAYGSLGGKTAPGSKANQQSLNQAISLSGQYRFMDTGFSVGASYLYANPLNNCTYASQALYPANNGNPCWASKTGNVLNPDTTLPQFELSTLYQAYLQYNANGLYFKGGNQVINTPWAPSSDSRLKPVAYQGVDLAYKIASNWTIEGSDFWQWECRTCSNFDHGTLLTVVEPGGFAYSGANAYATNYYDPTETPYYNNGFLYGRIGYSGTPNFPLVANLYYYSFDNIANAVWADLRYPFASTGRYKAFIGVQGGSEANTGTSLVGKVSSDVYGVQAGFNPVANIQVVGSYDNIPIKTDDVTLPTGFTCSATHTISVKSAYKGNLPYFLPDSGTGNCAPLANGETAIVYGGWASPYTDTYATDPLYTTSGSQGMIDRRSPGQSAKIGATFTSDNKQVVLALSQAWYDYNNIAYAQGTNEFDVDGQYFFKHVPTSGPYKGFSVRVRLFSRAESDFVGGSMAGQFKYNRFQAEYDF